MLLDKPLKVSTATPFIDTTTSNKELSFATTVTVNTPLAQSPLSLALISKPTDLVERVLGLLSSSLAGKDACNVPFASAQVLDTTREM